MNVAEAKARLSELIEARASACPPSEAEAEDMAILTRDGAFEDYGVRRVW